MPGSAPDVSAHERRRTPRKKPAGLSYVKIEPDNGGALIDVSESGIRFQVIAPVEHRGGIKLWFVLDAGNHIEASAEVAWIDETKRSGGLKLTRASGQSREQLQIWLSHQPPDRSAGAPHQLPAVESGPAPEKSQVEEEFEARLRNLRHTSPAPLEYLLKQIMASLERQRPQEIFASVSATRDRAQAPRQLLSPAASAPAVASRPLVPRNNPPQYRSSQGGGFTGSHQKSTAPPARPPERKVEPPSLPHAGRSADFKFSEFQRSIERVRGLLGVLRYAIVSEDSEWPLTEAPEFVPPEPVAESPRAIAVESKPVAQTPLASATMASAPQPIAPAAAPPNPETARPLTPSAARGTAARAPVSQIAAPPAQACAAAPAIAKSSAATTWFTKTAQALRAVFVTYPRTFAIRSVRVAANCFYWIYRTIIVAPLCASSRFVSRVFARCRRWAAAVWAWRMPEFLRPRSMARKAKNGLTVAAGGAKRTSSVMIESVIPARPTSTDLRIMLAVTSILLLSLAGFSYREKLANLINSSDEDYTSHSYRATDPPAPETPIAAPTPSRLAPHARAKSAPPTHVAAAKHIAAAAPAAGAAIPRQAQRSIPAAKPAPPAHSSPELRNALAYLKDNGRRDPATAANWLWAASRKGDTSANLLLADLYIRGDGVPQSCAQGRVLLLAASKKGNEEAARKLHDFDANGCPTSAD